MAARQPAQYSKQEPPKSVDRGNDVPCILRNSFFLALLQTAFMFRVYSSWISPSTDVATVDGVEWVECRDICGWTRLSPPSPHSGTTSSLESWHHFTEEFKSLIHKLKSYFKKLILSIARSKAPTTARSDESTTKPPGCVRGGPGGRDGRGRRAREKVGRGSFLRVLKCDD